MYYAGIDASLDTASAHIVGETGKIGCWLAGCSL
jgi:hypothetical protein